MTAKPRIVCICGETATGKTRISIDIAKRFLGEVVNADSMQVYRGMDIGTAKPTIDEQSEIPFHLIDVADPDETYSAGRFREDAEKAIGDILSRGLLPVISGGTGLYLKVLVHGIIEGPPINRDFREAMKKLEAENPGFLHSRLSRVDPAKASELSGKDQLRLIRALEVHEDTGKSLSAFQEAHRFGQRKYDVLKLGIKRSATDLEDRIKERAREMIANGFESEVRRLLEKGIGENTPSTAAVGYREMIAFINGEIDLDQAVEKIVHGTKRLAKRQRTWFRADKEILWFSLPEDSEKLITAVYDWLETK